MNRINITANCAKTPFRGISPVVQQQPAVSISDEKMCKDGDVFISSAKLKSYDTVQKNNYELRAEASRKVMEDAYKLIDRLAAELPQYDAKQNMLTILNVDGKKIFIKPFSYGRVIWQGVSENSDGTINADRYLLYKDFDESLRLIGVETDCKSYPDPRTDKTVKDNGTYGISYIFDGNNNLVRYNY